MKPDWKGVFPAVTTQFHEDLTLDLAATERHLELLIQAGVQGLIVCGSLGENQVLEPEEKRALVTLAVRTSGGRVPVLTGVAENSTAAAARYARDAERLGADGLMLLPAMVYRSDPRETVSHFRTVAAAGGLPIIAYNNPIGYGVDLTPALLAELADVEKIVAVKESSGDTRRITDLLNTVGDRYLLFTGVDDLLLESVLLGARGWIAGATLAFPREGQYLWELAASGRWEEARALYRWFTPLLHLDIGPKFVQKLKLLIQEVGLGSERVRPPRLPLTGAEREQVLEVIREGLESRPEIPSTR